MNRQAGFNIIEMMVAVAVLGILLGFGVPGLQAIMQNNRLTSQINQLSTALALARSEAIKLNERVVVCASTDGAECAATSDTSGWDDGWVVFVDRNADSDVDAGGSGVDDCADDSTTDCVLATQDAFPGTNTLVGGDDVADFLVYIGDGSVRCNTDADATTLETCGSADAFFTLCDFRGAAHAKALAVSATGRVSNLAKQPNGSALTCP